MPYPSTHTTGRSIAIEVCCGTGGLTRSLGNQSFRAIGLDILSDDSVSASDAPSLHSTGAHFWPIYLCSPPDLTLLRNLISSGLVCFVHFAIPCNSFRILRIRGRCSSRTRQNRWGAEAFTGEAEGNRMVKSIVGMIQLC